MKVIFINTFHGYNRNREVYYPDTDGFYMFGMGQFIAREFMKRDSDISFENWRMDLRINEIMEKKIDGIQCRIFPSKQNRMLFGEYSKLFVQELKKEAEKSDTVFHFMGSNNLNYHYFTRFLKKNRVVASHLGGANSYWQYHNTRKGLKNKLFNLIRYLGEKYILLNSYNHFITISKSQVNFYNRVHRPVTHMPILGISNEHLFCIKDRIECRKQLGLPLDKKIVLQIGRAYQNRGFDWIIKMLDDNLLGDEYYFMFVGINKEDEYHQELVKRGYDVVGYSSPEVLADYYNAADVLIYLPHNLSDLNFAGTSYVPLEALLCGTPIIATTMHHFPSEEINEIARIPRSYNDVMPMIEEITNSKIKREKCRKIVLKYFSWTEVLDKYLDIYNNIN